MDILERIEQAILDNRSDLESQLRKALAEGSVSYNLDSISRYSANLTAIAIMLREIKATINSGVAYLGTTLKIGMLQQMRVQHSEATSTNQEINAHKNKVADALYYYAEHVLKGCCPSRQEEARVDMLLCEYFATSEARSLIRND